MHYRSIQKRKKQNAGYDSELHFRIVIRPSCRIDGCGMDEIYSIARNEAVVSGYNTMAMCVREQFVPFRSFTLFFMRKQTHAHTQREEKFDIPLRCAHNAHKHENERRKRAQVVTHLKNGIRVRSFRRFFFFLCFPGEIYLAFECDFELPKDSLTSEWKRQQCHPTSRTCIA